MLSLVEELLLIAMNEENGKLHSVATWTMGNGLFSAMLLELACSNKITIAESRIKVIDPTPSNNEALDALLSEIVKREKPLNASEWYTQLQNKVNQYKQLYWERLVKAKIIKEEEGRFLLFFTRKYHFLKKKKLKRQLKERIRYAVLRRHTPDTQTVNLMGVIQRCQWTHLIFEKDKRKQAKQQIPEIIKKNLAVDEAIRAAQIALLHITPEGVLIASEAAAQG